MGHKCIFYTANWGPGIIGQAIKIRRRIELPYCFVTVIRPWLIAPNSSTIYLTVDWPMYPTKYSGHFPHFISYVLAEVWSAPYKYPLAWKREWLLPKPGGWTSRTLHDVQEHTTKSITGSTLMICKTWERNAFILFLSWIRWIKTEKQTNICNC